MSTGRRWDGKRRLQYQSIAFGAITKEKPLRVRVVVRAIWDESKQDHIAQFGCNFEEGFDRKKLIALEHFGMDYPKIGQRSPVTACRPNPLLCRSQNRKKLRAT